MSDIDRPFSALPSWSPENATTEIGQALVS